ncbi:hypothetical protein V1511DRAFT_528615 [Dipodascopsis uninucleata]
MSLWQTVTELYPPSPSFTEKDLPDLQGKVYFITGATAGIGYELLRILYWKNATVFVAARNRELFKEVCERIMSSPAKDCKAPSFGRMELIYMDLADLTTIKPGAEELLSKTKRLDSVWYNAGVMQPPEGSKSVQGYELQWGVNVVAHFVLHRYLEKTIVETAKTAPPASVRVMWVASDANNLAPSPDGINWDDVNYEKTKGSRFTKYAQSKAGDILLGYEYAQRCKDTGVLSLKYVGNTNCNLFFIKALNPGHLNSNLYQYTTNIEKALVKYVTFDCRLGALTELFAGFSPKITEKDNGAYFVPWGRFGSPRSSTKQGLLKRGTSKRLWDMLESETAMY